MSLYKPSVSSITVGTRQSNFEVLRIIAMLMVLALHADFIPFGRPTIDDFKINPTNAVMRDLIEALAIGGVNIFVMISGWFGIKPTIKGITSFLFQVFFFHFLMRGLMVIFGVYPFSFHLITDALLLTKDDWFVSSYLGLYVLSPVLNTYIERADKKSFTYLLIGYFAVEFYFGFIGKSPTFFFGSSTLSFIGLYLLSAYVRRYALPLCNKYLGLSSYLLSTLVITLFFIIGQLYIPVFSDFAIKYSSPVVILSALSLIVYTGKKDIGCNRYLNWVSRSVFAVYLFHSAPCIVGQNPYSQLVRWANSGGVIYVPIAIICVFIIAILVDQIRIFLYRQICRLLS